MTTALENLHKKLDEIREILVNGPAGQDEPDQFTPDGWDEEAVDPATYELANELRAALQRTQEARDDYMSRLATAIKERDHFIERAKEQGARLSEMTDQRDELQRWVEQLQAERTQLTKELERARGIKGELGHDSAEQLKQQRDEAYARLEKERQELGWTNASLEKTSTALADACEKRDQYKRERDQESARADKAEESLRLTAQRAKEAEEALDSAEKERDQYKRERDQPMSRNRELLERFRQTNQDHAQEKAEIRKERDEARERNAKLREERDVHRQDAETEQLRAQKAEETLKGIHGLVHRGILSGPASETVLKIHHEIHER